MLENLDISEAIGSLLHLSFVFDLKYSKEAETLCDIFQRRFAKYGDDSGNGIYMIRMMNVLFFFFFTGSRTNRKKTSAEIKMSKYLETLGKLLTDD